MAARVSNKVARDDDPANFVLMQTMGPNVSGVIGAAATAFVVNTAAAAPSAPSGG